MSPVAPQASSLPGFAKHRAESRDEGDQRHSGYSINRTIKRRTLTLSNTWWTTTLCSHVYSLINSIFNISFHLIHMVRETELSTLPIYRFLFSHWPVTSFLPSALYLEQSTYPSGHREDSCQPCSWAGTSCRDPWTSPLQHSHNYE